MLGHFYSLVLGQKTCLQCNDEPYSLTLKVRFDGAPSPDLQTQPAVEICAVLELSREPSGSGSPPLCVGAKQVAWQKPDHVWNCMDTGWERIMAA